MWADAGTILLGSVLLLFGTDSLVNGVAGLMARRRAEAWAFALGGALVAALAPLLALVIAALYLDQPELALGSILGGAIAQIGLLLGLSALIAPLRARLKLMAWMSPALILAVVLVWGLGLDHAYSRSDGGILLLVFAVLVGVGMRTAGRERVAAKALLDDPAQIFPLPLLLLRLLVGAVLLGLGGWRLLVGSSGVAGALTLNPLIAGLLIAGPLIALAGAPTALLAAHRGRGDFALTQALFGALAAILLVLGIYVVIHPLALASSVGRIELPVLFTLALAVYPMMRSEGELSRGEGLVLMLAWLAFLGMEIGLTFA